MVVWNWSADVWGAASLHMIPGETGTLSKFVSGFWRIVCTQRNLSTDHVQTHLNLTCLHAEAAPWGKANPFSRCSGIDLTLECWEDLCQMASVLHPLIGKSRKSGSFLRWLRKSILQLCQPLMRVLIGREAICQFGVASWSFHPGSWPIWVKWMLDAKIRGAIWMLDWNKSYRLWPLWLQRWFHLWRSKVQIWLREVNWWCVHFQERVLWWPHQAKQRKDSWTESSPEMGEVVFSCRALGHSWYVLCWSIPRSCWGLTGPVYILRRKLWFMWAWTPPSIRNWVLLAAGSCSFDHWLTGVRVPSRHWLLLWKNVVLRCVILLCALFPGSWVAILESTCNSGIVGLYCCQMLSDFSALGFWFLSKQGRANQVQAGTGSLQRQTQSCRSHLRY